MIGFESPVLPGFRRPKVECLEATGKSDSVLALALVFVQRVMGE